MNTPSPDMPGVRPGLEMPEPGALKMGNFFLIREVGHGAMGEVWLGYDETLRRNVAIKMMRCEVASEESYVQRFRREAQAIARLNHPHIVHIHSIGDDAGTMYLVMEWVEGPTLSSRIRSEGALPRKDALRMMTQAAEALDFALQMGITHRDIKPGNIMLTNQGHVKITDFGLAKLSHCETQMTATGTPLGTPDYMSPEACRGEELDFRSDMYSLGITFYQMLTGTVPFSASTPMTVMYKHVHEPMPEPPVLAHLEQGMWLHVIKRMTAKHPTERFRSYRELLEALDQLQSASAGSGRFALGSVASGPVVNSASYPSLSMGSLGGAAGTMPTVDRYPAVSSTAPATAQPTAGWLARNRAIVGGAAAVALLVAGGLVYYFLTDGERITGYVSSVASAPVVTNATLPGVATPAPSPAAALATPVPSPALTPVAPATPQPGEGGLPRDESSHMERLLAAVPSMRDAYANYDFASLQAMLQSAAASPGLDAAGQQKASSFAATLEDVKSLRQQIVTMAPQRPGVASITKAPHGSLSLLSANDQGLYFRNAAGATVPLRWSELLPTELIRTAMAFYQPHEFKPKVDAIARLYPRVLETLHEGGPLQPGGAVRGPQAGAAAGGAPHQMGAQQGAQRGTPPPGGGRAGQPRPRATPPGPRGR